MCKHCDEHFKKQMEERNKNSTFDITKIKKIKKLSLKNDNKEVTEHLKKMWYDVCILEHDYCIEYDGYMTQILKFTLQCIADKHKIDLGLIKED